MILKPAKDPMGQAVLDYVEGRPVKKLRVLSSMFEEDEMPVPHLFRSYDDMPPLEQQALDLCRGRVLDVGACAGCHAMWLQNQGLDVTAIDVSPLSVEAMQKRGIREALLADFYEDDFGTGFDTIILLMNGTTVAGTLERMPAFLARLEQLLAPGGQVLIDSTDLRYIYEDEEGNFDYEGDDYYGHVDYRMQYGKVRGDRFDCLYVDPETMTKAAASAGFQSEILGRTDTCAYLIKLWR